MRKSAVAAALATAGLVAAMPVAAHHSFAMFDGSKTVTLKGTVKEFRWTNPHVALFLFDEKPGAEPVLWGVELTSPGNLTRLGWTRKSLKPGDKVSVDVNPLRDGKKGGGFKRVVLADGQVLTGSLLDIEKKGGQ